MEGKKLTGVDFKAYYFNPDTREKIPTFHDVGSANECQESYCKMIPSCKAFVYNKAANPPTCNIKNAWATNQLVDDLGKIFGPKYCPGMSLLRYGIPINYNDTWHNVLL